MLIFCTNIGSLLNKLNELCFLVEHQNPKYDIIALLTYLPYLLPSLKRKKKCFEINLAIVNLLGYIMVISNITGIDGRFIIDCIKEGTNYTEVIFNTDFRESVWIIVKSHGKELLFGFIYTSPSSNVGN